MVRSFIIYLFAALIFSTILKASTPSDSSFAHYLYSQKEYYRAITEYQREIFLTKDSSKVPDLLHEILMCYYSGEDYDVLISFYEENKERFEPDSFLVSQAKLLYVKSLYKKEKYYSALFAIGNIDADGPLSGERNFIAGISYARIFNIEDAEVHFKHAADSGYLPKTMNELISSVKYISKGPKKSKILAGVMSAIIPGSGYIYSDRIGTGISSFIINSILIWGLRDAIINKQYGIGAAIAFFGTGWYVGNISGSYNAAEEYNDHLLSEELDKTLEENNLQEFILNQHQ